MKVIHLFHKYEVILLNADNLSNEITATHQMIKKSLAQTVELYGGNRSLGQIYSTLYIHGGPMTLDDLKNQTGMSKGSMSLGVRRLLDDKLIERVYRREERKDLYQTRGDFFQVFSAFFTKLWGTDVAINVETNQKAQVQYEAVLSAPKSKADYEEALRMLKKTKEALTYYTFLHALVEDFHSGEFIQYLTEKYNLDQ
jgi:HTH-type transcriptional regulator, glycine betaine synthesis regulator